MGARKVRQLLVLRLPRFYSRLVPSYSLTFPTLTQHTQVTVMGCIAMMVVGLSLYFFLRKSPVYLVDFSVHRAPER